MTVLLAPQHVARAAQLQVQGRNAKAGAQLTELFHGRKPLPGDFGKRSFRRNQQVGVGALMRSSYTPAQLVQLSQAEAIRAVNQDGVGARNVQTVLDDGRGYQNIRFVANEFKHDTFEFSLAHLSMAHDNASL